MNSIYSRPAGKPRTMAVTRRSREVTLEKIEKPIQITVDKSTECHVTPPKVAMRMVEYLADNLTSVDIFDASIVEPQAGTGNLINELIEYGVPVHHITAIERHYSLADVLRQRFNKPNMGQLTVFSECFLEWSGESNLLNFDAIITNPPFKKVKAHMRAAYQSLKENGVMVALVPSNYDDIDHDLLESLSSDTFSTCKVSTKIILIKV